MSLPLYSNHHAPRDLPKQAHHGLWFERFFGAYEPGTWQVAGPDGKGDPKKSWLTDLAGKQAGDRAALQRAADNRFSLARILGGAARCFATEGPFATGLGLPHPIENGFAWHPTLGVPYLAGSAVKGLLRAWLEAWQPSPCAHLDDWFGTTEAAGRFIFFDAVPVAPVSLTVDVMTPHMGDWYASGGSIKGTNPSVLPADWHDPNPVHFLAVKRAHLLVVLAPRRPADAELVPALFDHLVHALAFIGAGAKTAAGYGRFKPDPAAEADLAKRDQQRRLDLARHRDRAAMDPLDRQIADLVESKNDPDVALYQALEKGRWQGDIACRVAEKIRDLMKASNKWQPTPKKKNVKQHKRTKWLLDNYLNGGK